jgi:hypothetical protein
MYLDKDAFDHIIHPSLPRETNYSLRRHMNHIRERMDKLQLFNSRGIDFYYED